MSARNDDVSDINVKVLDCFLGEKFTYVAVDKMSEDEGIEHTITHRYPNEFLNFLNPTRLPPFKLDLRMGCPNMLL